MAFIHPITHLPLLLHRHPCLRRTTRRHRRPTATIPLVDARSAAQAPRIHIEVMPAAGEELGLIPKSLLLLILPQLHRMMHLLLLLPLPRSHAHTCRRLHRRNNTSNSNSITMLSNRRHTARDRPSLPRMAPAASYLLWERDIVREAACPYHPSSAAAMGPPPPKFRPHTPRPPA